VLTFRLASVDFNHLPNGKYVEIGMKRVVVVGGGYAGTGLAKALDKVAEVRLVDQRDRFVHNSAAIRSIVEPKLLRDILIPYDRLLKRGSFSQGTVSKIDENAVTLDDGTVIEGDIVVVATGSRYAQPFKAAGSSTHEFADGVRRANAQLRNAKKIAIVGGGSVGVELAGEIATAHPDKSVTILSNSATLLPGFSHRLAQTLQHQLHKKGVKVQLNTQATLESVDQPFTPQSTNWDHDLIFPALGATPVTRLFLGVPGIEFNAQGRVKVDSWLRPAGTHRLFALGDAAATGDPMTIVAITRQVPWLAKLIASFLAGGAIESLPGYKPWPSQGILVPLGPRDGASLLPVMGGIHAGKRVTSWIKGRNLFIPRYHAEFGYTPR
jgi:apoptosis-inducing factor 2